jgi:hypothetical protein
MKMLLGVGLVLVLLSACGGTTMPALVGDGGTGGTTGGTGGTTSGGGTTGGTSGGTSGDVVSACTSFCMQLLDCMGLTTLACNTACQTDPTGAFTNSGITCSNYAGVYNCLAGLPCYDLDGDAGASGALTESACLVDNGCH